MKVSIIGSGRVGLSFGVTLAKSGISAFMTDKNLKKKQAVLGESLAFYEPHLQQAIKENQVHLEWTRYTEKIFSAKFIFFCFSAPCNQEGEMDLREVFNWAKLIIENTKQEQFLIIKSTFPVGTNNKIQKMISENKKPLSVISCPEFLRQGQALKDISSPERLVIGVRDKKVGKKVEEFYRKFSKPKTVIYTDPQTAELSKLACNSFLATKISFINEFAGLCEQVKGNPKDLQLILGSDSRIGKDFLNSGLGYGGYCLPKDIQMSIQEGKNKNQDMKILKSVQKVNQSLTKFFLKKTLYYYKGLNGVSLAFWGIGFKKNTDDLQNSPALDLLCKLLKAGAELHVYDPFFIKEKVFTFFEQKPVDIFDSPLLKLKNFLLAHLSQEQESQIHFLKKKIISGKVFFYNTALKSLRDRQGLIIGSDCKEFQDVPLSEIKNQLKKPFLVDSRNLFSIEELKAEGFHFYKRGFSSLK